MEFRIKIVQGEKEKEIAAACGANLFSVLRDNGVYISNSCGGSHTCGKCLVSIESSQPAPLSEQERTLLKARPAGEGLRLACMTEVWEDMRVTVPTEPPAAQVFVRGIAAGSPQIDPCVQSECVTVQRPDMDDRQDDFSRLSESLRSKKGSVPLSVLKKLPFLMHGSETVAEVITYGDEIIAVVAPPDRQPHCGLAVDLGTTTVAVYLLNLENGEELDVSPALNPQASYGADIITRIDYSVRNKQGLASLQHLIIAELNRIINNLCHKNRISRDSIYEMMLVGNSTMLHFFCGIPCDYIPRVPFTPVFTRGLCFKARELGLLINEEGYISTLPCVSSYIGADTAAAVLAVGMHRDEQINLLVDLGTNGEIVLGNKNALLCCSTAAGPAFEGGKITYGMGGVAGAIDTVNLTAKQLYTTIGGIEARGICGSGLIDATAGLLRYGILDAGGRMRSREEWAGICKEGKESLSSLADQLADRMVSYEGKPAFLLDKTRGILLTQGDIRELQLAKAAVHAGVKVLLDALGVGEEQIGNVYLAGGFGNYLNTDSACDIGLLPDALRGKILPVGNAAGVGAKLALLSKRVRVEAGEVGAKMKCIDLSLSELFQKEFLQELNF